MLLIFLSFFLLSTFVAAMGSVCQSDGSMSSFTAGCISSTFLHMDSDRQVKVGLLFLAFFEKGSNTIWFINVGWRGRRGFHLSGCMLGSLSKEDQSGPGCEVEGSYID